MTTLATRIEMPVTARQPALPPDPGFYPNIPACEYHRWAAASQSVLKSLGGWENTMSNAPAGFYVAPHATPAHTKAYLDRKIDEKDTEAFRVGERVHCLLLEPERFVKQYRAMPKIDRRTSAGKAEYAALADTYGVENLIDADEWAELQAMAGGVARNDLARRTIAASGQTELSGVWIDDATGLACKMRLDKRIVTKTTRIIVDVKTTRCAHWRYFEADVAKYGYDCQAAHYVDGERILSQSDADAEYFILAVEKEPPYITVLYRVPPEVLDAGRTKNRAAMAELAKCISTDKWPGYADDRPIDLTLPHFAMAEVEPQ